MIVKLLCQFFYLSNGSMRSLTQGSSIRINRFAFGSKSNSNTKLDEKVKIFGK